MGMLDKVVKAVKETPNDMMLGEKIRQIYNQQLSHEMVINEMSQDEKEHLITWKGDEWTNKDGTPTQAYLDYWTCELCGKHTHEVDYDYLGNGTNHLGCELKQEDLQKKSDKIMKEVEDNMKNFDLSKSESNENSKVDMSTSKKPKEK